MNTKSITPPAGFVIGSADGDDAQWDGPKHATDKWQIATHWNPSEGIFYFIDHGMDAPWTPEEIDALPVALAEIKRQIELDAALVHLRNHPELQSPKVYITTLCEAADALNVSWGATAEAWTVLRDEAKR